MARVKRAMNSRKKHKKILKLAKGYYGADTVVVLTINYAD